MLKNVINNLDRKKYLFTISGNSEAAWAEDTEVAGVGVHLLDLAVEQHHRLASNYCYEAFQVHNEVRI